MLALVPALASGVGCRRNRPAPPPVEVEAPSAPAVENPPPPPPVVNAPPVAPPPLPPPPAPTGHAPTDDELRSKLQPLYPDLAKCVSSAGNVETTQDYLQLRFVIASGSGNVISAQLQGHERAHDCVLNVLGALHVEPWNGPPSTITLPLTKSGEPVPQSAFTDAGR
jgi:hypothetical protein